MQASRQRYASVFICAVDAAICTRLPESVDVTVLHRKRPAAPPRTALIAHPCIGRVRFPRLDAQTVLLATVLRSMAEWDKRDERWIVEDRKDGANVNAWHWEVRSLR